MLRDIFWLSTGQAIAMTNVQKGQHIEVREILAVNDGLIIKYLPNCERTSESFRALVKERIAINSEAQGITGITGYAAVQDQRTGSVH